MTKNIGILYLIISIFLFIFLIFLLFSNNKDNFTNSTKYNIILLGDSILNNSRYVKPGNSIEDILNKQIDSSKMSLLSLAKDGATITDVYCQIDKIPLYLNSSKTYIYLSAGGNDILNSVFNQININNLFEKYKILIDSITNRLPNTNIILLTLYYPQDPNYKKYKNIISIWNSYIKNIMRNNIITENIINNEQDIVNKIEPSFIGGQKIVNSILQKI
jgi:hypothetical protein